MANFFTDSRHLDHTAAIGELWRSTCAPALAPFKPREAEWAFLSLTPDRCRRLVDTSWTSASPTRAELLDACGRRFRSQKE